MRILIWAGVGFVNKGAEAMVRTVQQELSKRIQNPTFHLPAESAIDNAKAHDLILQRKLTKGQKLKHVFMRAARERKHLRRLAFDRSWIPSHHMTHGIDAVIDVRGYAYGDTWGPSKALQSLDLIRACTKKEIPYIFLPQAWGPFQIQKDHSVYRTLCDSSTILSARDSVSRENLKYIDLRNDKFIGTYPDIAFLFQGQTKNHGKQLLEEIGYETQTNGIVGIAPNQRVYEQFSGHGSKNPYIATLASLVKACLNHNKSIVLIPHEIDIRKRPRDDDRILCKLLAEHVSDPRVFAMADEYSAADIKAVIANVDILFGSRFHALVAALSQSIPVSAIGWSHKYGELLKPFGLEQFNVPLEQCENLDADELVSKMLRQSKLLENHIENTLPSVKTKVAHLFDLVADVVSKPCASKN